MNKLPQSYKIKKDLLTLLYAVFFIYAVFFARRRRHLNVRYLNILPFKTIAGQLYHVPVRSPFNYYSNLIGNILLFIPVSIILMSVAKLQKASAVLLIGFLVSFIIELLQYVFKIGVADIDDIILNTVGTGIGILYYNMYKKRLIHE